MALCLKNGWMVGINRWLNDINLILNGTKMRKRERWGGGQRGPKCQLKYTRETKSVEDDDGSRGGKNCAARECVENWMCFSILTAAPKDISHLLLYKYSIEYTIVWYFFPGVISNVQHNIDTDKYVSYRIWINWNKVNCNFIWKFRKKDEEK